VEHTALCTVCQGIKIEGVIVMLRNKVTGAREIWMIMESTLCGR
jgi:hypothetical protein